MKRIEVFLTQAIEEDFINYFEKACKEEDETAENENSGDSDKTE